MYRTIIILITAVTLASCYRSMESQLLQGHSNEAVLEEAIIKALHSRKGDKYLSLAERAYARALDADKRRVDILKANNADGSKWGEIYRLYKSMDQRQEIVLHYLPLYYSDGSEAVFRTYDLMPVLQEAREMAAEYHYDNAQYLLSQPGKHHAREAYDELIRIKEFYSQYRDSEALLAMAKDKGTLHILLTLEAAPYLVLPPGFREQLLYFNYDQYLDPWCRLYRDTAAAREMDREMVVNVEAIEIGPELVKETHYIESVEAENGTTPLLDAEGQYVIDTAGNIIQVTAYQTLTCRVTEWQQSKAAHIHSRMSYFDTKDGELLFSRPLEDHAVFEHAYATANGHIDILDGNVKALLNSHFIPFPPNFDMIMEAGSGLTGQVAMHLREPWLATAGLY